jgi:hypothetical protein
MCTIAMHQNGATESWLRINLCGGATTDLRAPQGDYQKYLSKYFSKECTPYNPAL